MDTVNELKEELLALKEAYEELDNEKQVLKNKLEGGSTNAELSPVNLSDEVCITRYCFVFRDLRSFRSLFRQAILMLSKTMKN